MCHPLQWLGGNSVCLAGCLPKGVSAQGGVCLGDVCLGDVCLGGCLPDTPLLNRMTDRCNYVADGKKRKLLYLVLFQGGASGTGCSGIISSHGVRYD